MKLNQSNAAGISIGIELVVSVLLGLGLGYWLDRRFGTSPWLTLVGIVLGSAAGFRSLLRLARRAGADEAPSTAEPSPPPAAPGAPPASDDTPGNA